MYGSDFAGSRNNLASSKEFHALRKRKTKYAGREVSRGQITEGLVYIPRSLDCILQKKGNHWRNVKLASWSFLHFEWIMLVAVGRTNLKRMAVVFWDQERGKLILGTRNRQKGVDQKHIYKETWQNWLADYVRMRANQAKGTNPGFLVWATW